MTDRDRVVVADSLIRDIKNKNKIRDRKAYNILLKLFIIINQCFSNNLSLLFKFLIETNNFIASVHYLSSLALK